MGGDTFKKMFTYSNPITAGIDIAEHVTGKEYSPKVSYKGVSMDPTALLSPVSAIGEGASVAGQQDALRKQAKAEDKFSDAEKKDDKEFEKFKAQEQSLLSGNSSELFVPKYKTGKRAAETDALAKVFQARKDQALARSSRPGVSQTRTGAL